MISLAPTQSSVVGQAMAMPPLAAASTHAKALGFRRGQHQIVPAFYNLLRHLRDEGREFSLTFRTFGADTRRIVDEFNAFCEGSLNAVMVGATDSSRHRQVATLVTLANVLTALAAVKI